MLEEKTISWKRYASETALLALAYFVFARLGQTMAIPPGNVTAVWPPSGLALAAFLLCGNRAWLGTFIGAYLANNSFFDYTTTDLAIRSISVGTVISIGSFLQPLVGRFLLVRYDGEHPLRTVGTFLRFCTIVPMMCLVSASFGSTGLCVGGFAAVEAWSELWFTWWLGDSVGVFVVVPFVMAWHVDRRNFLGTVRKVEAVGLLVAIVLSSLIAFTSIFSSETKGYPLEFLPLPFLLWPALRLGTRGAATSILLVETIAILGTASRQSPFIVESANHSLILLQLFIVVITMTVIVLSIFVEQNRRAERALQAAHDELEQRVNDRTLELSEATKQAERAAHEATAANRAKSVFLANISHEIRTPLNAIQGFAEILARRIADPQQNDYVQSIDSSSKTLLELIDNILDLTRTDSGELELAKQPISTVKLFSDLVDQYGPLANHKAITFNVEVDPGLPQVIRGDDRRLYQILSNLVDNAIKFTGSGRVSVKARGIVSERARGHIDLVVEVEDTGIGIPEEERDRIFGAFNQKSDQSINEYGGTGLGLALTQRLVEMMGGRVDVTSEVGVGSSFKVTVQSVEVIDPSTVAELEAGDDASTAELTEAWASEDLTDEARRRLPDLLSFLEAQTTTCEELTSTLTINEVEHFASAMTEKGAEHHYPPLTVWATRLSRQAETFDMVGLAES